MDFDASIKGRVLATIQTEETDLSVAMGQNFTEAGKPVVHRKPGESLNRLMEAGVWKKSMTFVPGPFTFPGPGPPR